MRFRGFLKLVEDLGTRRYRDIDVNFKFKLPGNQWNGSYLALEASTCQTTSGLSEGLSKGHVPLSSEHPERLYKNR